MQEQLQIISNDVLVLQDKITNSPPGTSKQFNPHVAKLASDAARLLVNEVLDWRVVFLDQPLKPPA